jgi:hypothetical protein
MMLRKPPGIYPRGLVFCTVECSAKEVPMSEFEMRTGLRHFLHMGGAETMSVEELLVIRTKSDDVIRDKGGASAKVVHFRNDYKRSKQVACGGFFYKKSINSDNSTDKLSLVTCGGCKNSKVFRKANGEDVTIGGTQHLVCYETEKSNWGDHSWRNKVSACSRSYVWADASAKTPLDVTCKRCLKTPTYTKRLASYNKRKAKKETTSV